MDEKVQEIIALLAEVEQKVESLRNKINGILSWVPWGLGWAVDKFRELWDQAMDRLGEFWDMIAPIANGFGAPWVINDRLDEWVDIGANVSEQVTVATTGELDVDNRWTGVARDAYVDALGNQRTALQAIKSTFTDRIVGALGDVSSALWTFFVMLAIAIAAMIAGIVLATGEAVSILGLPAVPPTVILAVVTAIGTIGHGINNLRSACNSANSTFVLLSTERTATGPDNWPRAVI